MTRRSVGCLAVTGTHLAWHCEQLDNTEGFSYHLTASRGGSRVKSFTCYPTSKSERFDYTSMADETLELLKELTEAHGVPGYEAPVRAVVRKYLEPLGEISQDKIGSVICKSSGDSQSPG